MVGKMGTQSSGFKEMMEFVVKVYEEQTETLSNEIEMINNSQSEMFKLLIGKIKAGQVLTEKLSNEIKAGRVQMNRMEARQKEIKNELWQQIKCKFTCELTGVKDDLTKII